MSSEKLSPMEERMRKLRKKGDEIVGPPRKMNVENDLGLTVKVGNDNNDDNKSFSERFLEDRIKALEETDNKEPEQPIEQKQEPNEDDRAESSRGYTIRKEQPEGGKKKTKKRKSSKKKTKKRKGKRKSGKKK